MLSRIVKRAERAKQEDDPHGLLTQGPHWTNKQNDPHWLLANRLKSAHKQGKPPGTLTPKGTQPTHVHVNPNRATQSKPGGQASHSARALSTDHRGAHVGHPQGDHNRNQSRPTGIIVVAILGILIIISMIIQGNKTNWSDTITNTGRTQRTQPHPEFTPYGTYA
jgi:hypothetical protein